MGEGGGGGGGEEKTLFDISWFGLFVDQHLVRCSQGEGILIQHTLDMFTAGHLVPLLIAWLIRLRCFWLVNSQGKNFFLKKYHTYSSHHLSLYIVPR